MGVTPRRARAVEGRAQPLRPALHDGLRRQHVHDLARADAERERAHAAVRAGVAVAADQQRAGQRQAQLRPDHVHDALAGLAEVEQAHAGSLGIGAHAVEALRQGRVGLGRAAGEGRYDMVEGCKRQLRIVDRETPFLERLECGGAAVMHEVPADVQQRIAVAEIGHHMPVPDLVEKSCGAHPIVSFLSGNGPAFSLATPATGQFSQASAPITSVPSGMPRMRRPPLRAPDVLRSTPAADGVGAACGRHAMDNPGDPLHHDRCRIERPWRGRAWGS